jgi:hypothetical protein
VLLQHLDAGEQFADADLADLVGAQAQAATAGVEVGLGVGDDAGAALEVRRTGVDHVAARREREAEIGRRVAQRDEHGAGARAARDLRHLPVDPDPAEPADPRADLLTDDANRPRLVGGRLRHTVTLSL